MSFDWSIRFMQVILLVLIGVNKRTLYLERPAYSTSVLVQEAEPYSYLKGSNHRESTAERIITWPSRACRAATLPLRLVPMGPIRVSLVEPVGLGLNPTGNT